jgi:hypothetical protein
MSAFGKWSRVLLVLGIAAVGCRKTPPPLTTVEGTVLLDGKPLPFAMVQFMPETSDFGAELNSTGVSDEMGHFTLTCNRQNEPGAVVGKHRVVVIEGPVPGDIRRNQDKAAEYLAKLKNRPIPVNYATYSQTPLIIDVTADQKEYTVKMTR